MTLCSSYFLCAMVRCSFFLSFTTGYTGYSKRTWLTWLSWGREIIFSPKHWHMFSIHLWKRMITARTHIIESWLKHVAEYVPVYYLGSHSFDRVCVIIKTTDFCSLHWMEDIQSTTADWWSTCRYHCYIWELAVI